MPRKPVDIRPRIILSKGKRGFCALFRASCWDGCGQRPLNGSRGWPLVGFVAKPQGLNCQYLHFQGSFEPVFFGSVFHKLLDTTPVVFRKKQPDNSQYCSGYRKKCNRFFQNQHRRYNGYDRNHVYVNACFNCP